ncbi:cytosol nonspecific dipeptidase [Candidatus Fermentibacteria bacterium]|nr:MAG: cytosol nonspecific dipeptidase [Candidatus Fermentibacteria bacterium]
MFPSELSEKPVWKFFKELCRIPRTSGDEGAVSRYLIDFAASRGLEYLSDDQMNVLIRKPGRGEAVALQAHMDMVGEKVSGSSHDFSTDPVDARLEGDLLVARETTLGADNGIGVALMLELLDGDYEGVTPLECLFTVDEERGLVGALGFPPEWITAERLINLDSEDFGVITIGCAGGKDAKVKLPLSYLDNHLSAVEVTVGGLNGGHSGMEIAAGNANAIKLAARVCREIEDTLDGRLVSFSGGTKHNAIPREAKAVLAVEDTSQAEALCSRLEKNFAAEYDGIEKSVSVRCVKCDSSTVMSPESSSSLIDLLLTLPHGVEKMSGVVEGLVETSCNLAIVITDREKAEILLSVRSALQSAKDAVVQAAAAAGRLAGAEVTSGNGYPGWTPDRNSRLLKAASEAVRRILGREPVIEAIHAGLECGIIGERVGNLDMISIGPDISNVHIPGENVSVSSTDSFLLFLVELLRGL